MESSVWGFRIPIKDSFSLNLPDSAKMLDVKVVNGTPQLYVLIREDWDSQKKVFIRLFRTSERFIMPDLEQWAYVGSFESDGYFHVFADAKFVYQDELSPLPAADGGKE